jgi:biopolymer transport protein ExbD
MAFSVNPGLSAGRRRFRGGSTSLAEINIVPLVDVVLVLLIIFMLTAHVMEFGMEVDVPKTKTVKDTAEILPVVNVARDGKLFLIDQPANINELPGMIAKRFKGAKAVYVRGDKEVPWEVMAQVFSQLGEAKLDVRAVTQPEESVSPARGR